MNKYLQLTAVFNLLLIVSSGTSEVNLSSGNTTDPPTDVAEADCTKCYKSLVTELLKNSDNYFNLQMTFFPLNGTSPDFVIVRYNYSENGTSTPKDSIVWFWSSAVYFFFHPIPIFRFTSFMFSDPLLQESKLTLHLPANCIDASNNYMRLLTQSLKLYAIHQNVNAAIDTSYQAMSHNVTTLKQWHDDNYNAPILVLSAQIGFPVLLTTYMVFFFVYIIDLEPQKFGQKLNNEIHSSIHHISANGMAKLLIILTISFLFNGCALTTDIFALTRYKMLTSEVIEYYETDWFHPFYIIPMIMTGSDVLSIIFIIIPVTISMVKYYRNKNTDENFKNNWSILLYTLLSPLSSISTHAYHIIIAFINNPYHASIMLLSFTAVLFMHVFVFQTIYYYIFRCHMANSQELSACFNPLKKLGCYMLGIITFSVVIVFTVFMMYLLLTDNAAIDSAIDNASTNIYTVFQASIAIIAAIVAFEVFFRETNSIAEVLIRARDRMVSDNNNEWNSMSEKEKELELAKQVLECISRSLPNQNQPQDHPPRTFPDHPPPSNAPADHPSPLNTLQDYHHPLNSPPDSHQPPSNPRHSCLPPNQHQYLRPPTNGNFATNVTTPISPQGSDEDISRVDDKTRLLPKKNNAVKC